MEKWRLFFFVIWMTVFAASQAQVTDCEQILIQADNEFNAGRFYGIPGLLNPCLERGFSDEQKVRAYLILTQTYLILDDPIAADDSYLRLLGADPEYVANPLRDPIDVFYLSKKFTTTPIFTPHFRIGMGISRPRIIYDLSTSGTVLNKREIIKLGYVGGVGVDWNINNNWSVCGELNFSYKAFKQEISGYFTDDRQEVTDQTFWFDVPFYLKYSSDSGNIRPFGYLGFAFNLLTSSSISAEFIDVKSNGQTPTSGSENIGFKRNFLNHSVVFGGGFKYKQGKNFWYVDVRYMAGLSNLSNDQRLYQSEDGGFDPLLTQFQYVGDSFRMDNLSVSVGYIKPIYNPRKKVKPRLSNLFNRKPKSTTNP